MNLIVYRRPDGTYLLMLDDSAVSKHVEEMHGPLVLCTQVRSQDLEDDWLRNRVLSDISNHSYSMINETIARQFVSLECACVPQDQGVDPQPLAA